MSRVLYPPAPVNSALAAELAETIGLAAQVIGLAAVVLSNRRPHAIARGLTDQAATELAARVPGAMAIEGRNGWAVVANAYRLEGRGV